MFMHAMWLLPLEMNGEVDWPTLGNILVAYSLGEVILIQSVEDVLCILFCCKVSRLAEWLVWRRASARVCDAKLGLG